MAFHWQVTPSELGVDVEVAPEANADANAFSATATAQGASFPTQGDAETYLGEHWRRWAAAGVTAVTLVDGTTAVYDMSLLPD